MMLNFFERRKILKKANYFDLTPVRIYKEEMEENGLATIIIPKFTNKLAVKIFNKRIKSDVIKIKLDEVGTTAWLAMNGRNKVGDIAKIMVDKLGDKVQPVDERLPKFITHLYEQKYISFVEINK
ncbi:PqqD family protein [Bacteroidota bacterium]